MNRSISHSRMAALECPFYFGRMYLDGARDRLLPNPAAHRGQLFHSIFAAYCWHLMDTGQQYDGEKLDFIARKWTLPVPAAVRNDVLTLCAKLANWRIPEYCDKDSTRAEVKLAVRLVKGVFEPCPFDAPDAFFRGVLDLADVRGSRALIRDVKTGWEILKPGKIADDEQLRQYRWLLKIHFPEIEEFDIGHIYPRLNFYEATAVVGTDDLDSVPDTILAAHKRQQAIMAMPERPAQECAQCKFCALDCPLKLEGIEVAPSSPEAASKLAKEVEWHEQQLARKRGFLKDYCGACGPVVGTSQEYGVWPVATYELTEDAFNLIREREPELLVASKSAINDKLKAKKRAGLRDELEPFKTEVFKSWFGGRKPGEPEGEESE